MTITLDLWDACLIAFLAFLVWLLGYITGRHDEAAKREQQPRGLLDDASFAAALNEVERKAAEKEWEAIAADEREFERRRAQQMEHGFRDIFGPHLSEPALPTLPQFHAVSPFALIEAEQIAQHAWWAREIDDGEDEARA